MKLILCLAIVAISAALGRQFSNRAVQRVCFFRDYQTAVTYLSDKVVGMNIELCKALQACQSESIRPLFDACAQALRDNPALSLECIWRQKLASMQPQLGLLSKEDRRLFCEGGAAIDALCANPSERQAALYLKRLGQHLDSLEAEKTKKCRLYNMAGLLGGLLIALLLI